MVITRIGLIPATTHTDASLLYRSALVISRAKVGSTTSFGRAALGSLVDDADAYRLARVGAVIVWGSQDAEIARLLLKHKASLMIVVLKQKPHKDSAVTTAMARLESQGVKVCVYTIAAKGDVVALDIAPGCKVMPVEDLRSPISARNHSAPSVPRTPAPKRAVPAAPSTPRQKPAPAPKD